MTTLFNLKVDMDTKVVEDNNGNQSRKTGVEPTEDKLEVAIPRDKANTKHLAGFKKESGETSFHTSSLTSPKDSIIPIDGEANRIKKDRESFVDETPLQRS